MSTPYSSAVRERAVSTRKVCASFFPWYRPKTMFVLPISTARSTPRRVHQSRVLPLHLDVSDHVALRGIRPLGIRKADDRVVAIERGLGRERDEELARGRVAAADGHADR